MNCPECGAKLKWDDGDFCARCVQSAEVALAAMDRWSEKQWGQSEKDCVEERNRDRSAR